MGNLQLELVKKSGPAPIPPLNLSTGMTFLDHVRNLGSELSWKPLKNLHEQQCDYARTTAGDRCIRGEYIVAQWFSEMYKEGVVRLEVPVRIVGEGKSYKCAPDVYFKNGVTWFGEVFDNPPKREENFVGKCRKFKQVKGTHKVLIAAPEDQIDAVEDWGLKGSSYIYFYFDDSIEKFEALLRRDVSASDLLHRIKIPR
jgi:hypothetical protein